MANPILMLDGKQRSLFDLKFSKKLVMTRIVLECRNEPWINNNILLRYHRAFFSGTGCLTGTLVENNNEPLIVRNIVLIKKSWVVKIEFPPYRQRATTWEFFFLSKLTNLKLLIDPLILYSHSIFTLLTLL